MRSFTSRNVNTMLRAVLPAFKHLADPFPSRNGPVLRMMGPTALTYVKPLERVCFCEQRDANPYFHLMEAMWMLAGRNDVAWISYFNGGMVQYSDDGVTFNAAYGFRLRHHFDIDQLDSVVKILRVDPYSRQAVAQMWDSADLTKVTKDKACNLCLVFTNDAIPSQPPVLGMTVYNRSNDAVWGTVAGANPVHMSYFMEYVADCLGWKVGDYHQITANLHYYTGNEKYDKLMDETLKTCNLYDEVTMWPNPSVAAYHGKMVDLLPDEWMLELKAFCAHVCSQNALDPLYVARIRSDFISSVLAPIYMSWWYRKNDRPADGMEQLKWCAAADWRLACRQWCERRTK